MTYPYDQEPPPAVTWSQTIAQICLNLFLVFLFILGSGLLVGLLSTPNPHHKPGDGNDSETADRIEKLKLDCCRPRPGR